jgi:hypothetical protein
MSASRLGPRAPVRALTVRRGCADTAAVESEVAKAHSASVRATVATTLNLCTAARSSTSPEIRGVGLELRQRALLRRHSRLDDEGVQPVPLDGVKT